MINELLNIILVNDANNNHLLFIDAEKGIENKNHHSHGK